MADTVGSRARILHMPPGLALAVARSIGICMGDVVLTADELKALSAGLLAVPDEPAGSTKLTAWLEEHGATVGTVYASELKRHY